VAKRLIPNAAETRWLEKVVNYGCLACWSLFNAHTEAEAHHIVGRSGVNGHWLLLPLCTLHHRGGDDSGRFLSVHPFKKRFEAKHGTQIELFQKICDELNDGELPWIKFNA